MKYETALKFFTKPIKIARALNVSRSRVSYWKRAGYVPFAMALELERITGGKLKVDSSVYGRPRDHGTTGDARA